MGEWIDLLDPSPEELAATLRVDVHESDLAQLRAGGAAGRPGLWAHEDHIVGVLAVLLAGTRDYYQVKVAQDQNETIKRLTGIASLLLVPAFIVGLYGQNFVEMPEFHWGIWGYIWSWGLIVAATLIQLWYFRREHWL